MDGEMRAMFDGLARRIDDHFASLTKTIDDNHDNVTGRMEKHEAEDNKLEERIRALEKDVVQEKITLKMYVKAVGLLASIPGVGAVIFHMVSH